MSEKSTPAEFQQILTDDLPLDQERNIIEAWVRKNPQAAPSLLPVLLTQKHRYKRMYDELTIKLRQSPWYPATFIRMLPKNPDRALVSMGSRRFSVALAPEVPAADLQCGATVLLNSDTNILLSDAGDLSREGQLGSSSDFMISGLSLKGTVMRSLLWMSPAGFATA